MPCIRSRKTVNLVTLMVIIIQLETSLATVKIGNEDCQLEKQDTQVNCSGLGIKEIGEFPIQISKAISLVLSRNNLTSLIGGVFDIFETLIDLDLSQNQLEALDANIFVSLIKLQFLNLHENQLTTLDGSMFSFTTKLLILHLAFNKLETLDGHIFESLVELEILNAFAGIVYDLYGSPLVSEEVLFLICYNNLANLSYSLVSLGELDLAHNKLETLDGHIFDSLAELETLILFENELRHLVAGTFNSLVSLTLLNLAHNKLETLEGHIFESLVELDTLILARNEIRHLVPETFDSLFSLTILALYGNKLKNLEENIFSYVPWLKIVDVAENQLVSLHEGTLNLLSNLEELMLDGNPLTTLDYRMFDHLEKLVYLALPGICNCTENMLFMIPFLDKVRYDAEIVVNEKNYTEEWKELSSDCTSTWIDHPYCDSVRQGEWSEWRTVVDCSTSCGKGKQLLIRSRYVDCVAGNMSEVKTLECYGNKCNGSSFDWDNWYENMKSNSELKSQMNEELEAFRNELKVDKKTTNAALRRRISIRGDRRMSSTVMGGFAAITVFIPFLLTICSDLCPCESEHSKRRVGKRRRRKIRSTQY